MALRDEGLVHRVTAGSCPSQRLNDNTDFHGYKVLKCLGKGFDGEAYFVTENNTGREHVLKIGRNDENGIGHHECEFAKQVKQIPALRNHVTNCTDHGAKLQDHPEEYEFIVMEKAPGKLLAEVLMEAIDAPPEEFQDLPTLLHTISDMIELNNQLVNNGFFHKDLHIANLFLTPHKALVAIDYGRTSRLDPDNVERRNMAGKMFWNVLAMLVQPTRTGFPPMVMRILQNGVESFSPNQTAHEIRGLMRAAYKLSHPPEGDQLLTEVLIKGFTPDSYESWPPSWVDAVKKLQDALGVES